MEAELFEINNPATDLKAGLRWGDATYHFKSKREAIEFKDMLENFKATKQMLTELHHLIEFTNPAFKPGNSVYDRCKKLIYKN